MVAIAIRSSLLRPASELEDPSPPLLQSLLRLPVIFFQWKSFTKNGHLPAGYHHRKNHLLNLSAKAKRCRIHLSKRHRFAIASIKYHRLVLSADVADVIIADHNFFQSTMLTSSLLISTSSSRHADVIIADSRFLFTSTSGSFTLAQQLVFVLHNWFQTSTI
ncbi:hypothetical protein F511_37398 [Dorcoceras hygrometricum]|uniref:Uncharacterized protein n=1 Tax=Dorcoceras hygrometricum TaxID=472368 RepID=A0A2Z7CID7_9LAMI|nr:hypothetical protein F511_37398 [Dorcoceras hygrometricum]